MTFPDNGIAGLVLKPWGQRKTSVFDIVPQVQQKVSAIPGVRTMLATPSALPGGGQFPVEFVIAATAEPEVIVQFAQKLQQKAAASGMFAFPPVIDTSSTNRKSNWSWTAIRLPHWAWIWPR
jgi:multidrug efflux pump